MKSIAPKDDCACKICGFWLQATLRAPKICIVTLSLLCVVHNKAIWCWRNVLCWAEVSHNVQITPYMKHANMHKMLTFCDQISLVHIMTKYYWWSCFREMWEMETCSGALSVVSPDTNYQYQYTNYYQYAKYHQIPTPISIYQLLPIYQVSPDINY